MLIIISSLRSFRPLGLLHVLLILWLSIGRNKWRHFWDPWSTQELLLRNIWSSFKVPLTFQSLQELPRVPCTANIYSQFTVIDCVTCATVIWQWLSQTMTVLMTLTDIKEYNIRSIAILGCNIYSQITVAHVTLPKAVLNTVKIFAVWSSQESLEFQSFLNFPKVS